MKSRRCSHCKKKGPQEEMLLRQLKAFCGTNCFAEWAAANVSKLAKKGKQIERKAFNERKRKVKLNDISHQRDMTQKAFNKMRVLQELDWFYSRGLEPTCISCGNPLGNDQWCCGHYKSRGAYPELRFDPMNTYLQHNRRCNMGLSGDIAGTKKTHGYTEGLKLRFGEVEGQKIIDYCNSPHEIKNYTCEELAAMRAEFNRTIRELEKKAA